MTQKQQKSDNPDWVAQLIGLNTRVGKLEGRVGTLTWLIGILCTLLAGVIGKLLLG